MPETANSHELQAPYQDPELQRLAQGDSGLLNRLVAMHQANRMLEKDPNEHNQSLLETMREEVNRYADDRGLQRPDNLAAPE